MGRVLLNGFLAIAAATAWPSKMGSTAWAAFPDVPPWHWAHDGLQKAQDAGIVIGYPAATAEPIENSVF